MSDSLLKPEQIKVIEALAAGATSSEAAALAGVHRNTVAAWRRNSLVFAEALSDARYEKALLIREKAEALVGKAWLTLEAILDDPKASPAAKIKAAIYILDRASYPPQEKALLLTRGLHIVQPVHNSAQSTVPAVPAVGRNAVCPCGSGQKFKRCCLGKPHAMTSGLAA